jgi:hypothetical protein
MVGDYQTRLAGLPGLDLVPVEWLHLTVQAIGFAVRSGLLTPSGSWRRSGVAALGWRR